MVTTNTGRRYLNDIHKTSAIQLVYKSESESGRRLAGSSRNYKGTEERQETNFNRKIPLNVMLSNTVFCYCDRPSFTTLV